MVAKYGILGGIVAIVSILFMVMLYFNVIMPATAGVGYKVTSDLTADINENTTIGNYTNQIIETSSQTGVETVQTGGSFIKTLMYIFLLSVFLLGIFAVVKFR